MATRCLLASIFATPKLQMVYSSPCFAQNWLAHSTISLDNLLLPCLMRFNWNGRQGTYHLGLSLCRHTYVWIRASYLVAASTRWPFHRNGMPVPNGPSWPLCQALLGPAAVLSPDESSCCVAYQHNTLVANIRKSMSEDRVSLSPKQ